MHESVMLLMVQNSASAKQKYINKQELVKYHFAKLQ